MCGSCSHSKLLHPSRACFATPLCLPKRYNSNNNRISHCFCNPKGVTWVADTSHSSSTVYEFESYTTTVTSTTRTATTATTTSSATTTTNTIVQSLQGGLSDVEKQMEAQIQKTNAELKAFERKVTAQAQELSDQASAIPTPIGRHVNTEGRSWKRKAMQLLSRGRSCKLYRARYTHARRINPKAVIYR